MPRFNVANGFKAAPAKTGKADAKAAPAKQTIPVAKLAGEGEGEKSEDNGRAPDRATYEQADPSRTSDPTPK